MRNHLTATLLYSALSISFLSAQSSHGPVEVSGAVKHDLSAPLRTISAPPPQTSTPREVPLRLIPHPNSQGDTPDAAEQNFPLPFVGVTAGLNFAGVGQGDYGFSDSSAPPDTNGAVGATQYVQWVNTSFAVFDKTTGAIAPGFPKAGNAPWSGFGGKCETSNDGDPIAQYDKAANRWILTQFVVSSTPYLQCVAISQTSDATGAYNRYSFSYGTTQFVDYPKLGVWQDAYYISYNIFTNGVTFAGAKACAFERAKMLTGDPSATQQCFQLTTAYGGLLPSDFDGTIAPPTGSPDYFVNFGTNSLNLWKFHVDFTTPTNSTFTGPTNIPVTAFTAACNNGGTCIPQPSTTQKLDSLADRLMYRLAYRNFADGHEALVVNHSVSVGSTRRAKITSVRWYELRSPGTTPVVFQQGTLSTADKTHRWMGSIAMDKMGNMALGYSASSSTVPPSIRYTGRLATDPVNTMETEASLQIGIGSQTTGLSRWGDYSAMTVDPVDDCTFWYTSEYLKTNGTFNWSTKIGNFKFPNCN